MAVEIIPHTVSMRNYLVIAHHADDAENLDWIVSTTDAQRAVELWRAYLIEEIGWKNAEEVAERAVITNVVLLPPVSGYERVWNWAELFVPGWLADEVD